MEKIKLWEKTPLFEVEIGQEEPSITPYLVEDGRAHGAVIVCPGGGYAMKAEHEGAPIAKAINAQGFHAFVLDYRVAPYRYPVPLMDAHRAIRYVRFHARELGVKADKIGILGFSAGGNLACLAATKWDAGDAAAVDPVDRVSSRPDLFVPCYPVASLMYFRNEGTAYNLLGQEVNPAQLRALSAECLVDEKTPPCFLWHTAEDGGVPVENSLRLAKALVAKGVPVSLHVYPYGPHGVGLGDDRSPLAESWMGLLGDFMRTLDF